MKAIPSGLSGNKPLHANGPDQYISIGTGYRLSFSVYLRYESLFGDGGPDVSLHIDRGQFDLFMFDLFVGDHAQQVLNAIKACPSFVVGFHNALVTVGVSRARADKWAIGGYVAYSDSLDKKVLPTQPVDFFAGISLSRAF